MPCFKSSYAETQDILQLENRPNFQLRNAKTQAILEFGNAEMQASLKKYITEMQNIFQ